MAGSMHIGRAASAPAAAISKSIRLKSRAGTGQSGDGDARRVGYIGAGGFNARERISQRRPYASFFGYFLVWYKKVT